MTKISIKQLCEDEGMTLDELLAEYGSDSIMPACCSEGCNVEPDGTCEHGNKSILLELGMI